eukprot:6184736-Pleurochrysis_carterae.AAC.1
MASPELGGGSLGYGFVEYGKRSVASKVRTQQLARTSQACRMVCTSDASAAESLGQPVHYGQLVRAPPPPRRTRSLASASLNPRVAAPIVRGIAHEGRRFGTLVRGCLVSPFARVRAPNL